MRRAADEAIKGKAQMRLSEAVHHFTRLLIYAAIEEANGNLSRAGERLKMTKRGMEALIIDYGLIIELHNLRRGRGKQRRLPFMRKPPEGIWVDAAERRVV
jgi:hypothetical protein